MDKPTPKRRIKTHTGKSKVKSGCRTCKIRKVKCDEGRPACHRCVSTGRVCDGYGIWGNGGNTYSDRMQLSRSSPSSSSTPSPTSEKDCDCVPISCFTSVPTSVTLSITWMSTHEKYCLQWFMCQTVKKFPGTLSSPFWHTLVCQASNSEPAILHGVLALSSAHKKDGLDTSSLSALERSTGGRNPDLPDSLEQFTLRQYSTAIGHLQPHFVDKSKSSVRIAMVTCLLFVYMEFLRGHYQVAMKHLRSGLKLLKESQDRKTAKGGEVGLVLNHKGDFVDECIVTTFVKLQIQALLFGQTFDELFIAPQVSNFMLQSSVFKSITEARHTLDQLHNNLLYLSEESARLGTCPGEQANELIRRQKRLENDLESWLTCYRASQPTTEREITSAFAGRVLVMYHTLAKIMTATALFAPTEARFDDQLGNFASLITQSIYIWNVVMSTPQDDILPGCCQEISDSVAELGWIPLLYFTALKCRNHRIRVQACKLMRSLPHKEGMWDAVMAASIAEQVVDIEEGDYYKNLGVDDGFKFCSAPSKAEAELEMLPERYRVCSVKVDLPEGKGDKAVVTCQRRLENGNWEVIGRECYIRPVVRVVKPRRRKGY